MKKYILIIAAFFMAGISGCKKNYLDLETNPNTPSVTTPGLTLAAALNSSAAIIVNDYSQYGVWDGYWTTSGNYVPNPNINQYQFTNAAFDGDWTDWYLNLTNYNILQGISAKSGATNYEAIAMIMKAYGFSHLVDQYNDVPYTQAFQGTAVLLPVYDKGPAIYADLFKQLDAAIALINKGGSTSTPGADDIVFGGDMTGWVKFANSLKLRMAMRVSGLPGGASPAAGFSPKALLATTVTAADVAGTETNFFGENIEAGANPGYSNVGGKQNPYYGTYGYDPTGNPSPNNVYFRANAYCVGVLNSFTDPRVSQYYTLVPTSNTDATPRVHGNVFGDVSINNLTNSFNSATGPGLTQSASQNAILFSGAESLFLQAEAVQDGFLTGDAQSLYEGGITAAFGAVGLTAAQAATYYGQNINNVGWAASSNKYSAILIQKWISLNGYFNFEAWNEFRRTNYPALPSSIDPAAINPTLPTRLPYPLIELETNPGNLAKEGTINPFTSHIFWDLRTTIN